MGTRLVLGQREPGAGLAAIIYQDLDRLAVVLIHQIHHELLGSPQQAGQTERPLIRAAHDEHLVANPVLEQAGGFQPDRQPPILPRVRKLQLIHVPQVSNGRLRLIDNGGIALAVNDFLPAGLGQCGIIEIDHAAIVAVFVLADDLRLHHPGRIAHELANLDSGRLRRELE